MNLEEKFFHLFKGFSKFHGQAKPGVQNAPGDKRKCAVLTINGGPTISLWKNHLDGKLGLGIIPLLDDETLSFACIDIDKYDNLNHKSIEQQIKKFGYPLHLCRSKSGGAHLYLFMDKPYPAKEVLVYVRHMAATLGYGECEVFPKHSTRSVEVAVSNWINMPYFDQVGETFSPAMRDGLWVSAEQFVEFVWRERVSLQQLKTAAEQKEFFEEGPPCLNILVQQGITGYKNNFMFNVAVYYKQANPEGFVSKVHVVHDQLLNNSGTTQEIDNILKQVSKKDVKYMCKEPPLCDVCNKVACAKKKYGVASISEKGWVLFDGLVKLVDPCGGESSYTLHANGIPVWLSCCDDLLNQRKFRNILFDKANVLISPVKQTTWDERIRDLMEGMQEVPLPTDATLEGSVLSYLADYINLTSRGSTALDALAKGRVFITTERAKLTSDLEKIACLHAPSFSEFLKQNGMGSVSQKKIFKILHTARGIKNQVNIGGKNIQYWKVNLNLLTSIVGTEIDLTEVTFEKRPDKKTNVKETIIQTKPFDNPDVGRQF